MLKNLASYLLSGIMTTNTDTTGGVDRNIEVSTNMREELGDKSKGVEGKIYDGRSSVRTYKNMFKRSDEAYRIGRNRFSILQVCPGNLKVGFCLMLALKLVIDHLGTLFKVLYIVYIGC